MTTTSLDTSKKLEEAGFSHVPEWFWVMTPNGKQLSHCYDAIAWREKNNWECFAAPTTDELLGALPSSLPFPYYEGDSLAARKELGEKWWIDGKPENAVGWLSLDKSDDGTWSSGYGDDGTWVFGEFTAPTPVESLAFLWLELKSKKII